jgi:hypothetical protein
MMTSGNGSSRGPGGGCGALAARVTGGAGCSGRQHNGSRKGASKGGPFIFNLGHGVMPEKPQMHAQVSALQQ